MSLFRIGTLGALARQMAFTPQAARTTQVAAAEKLLHEIDPGKAYPLDFIIYRITAYRPKTVAADLLTGLALQHDLGLLIELVSRSLNMRSADHSEPVLTIEDVGERFNVSTKTIQRWRRKGLPARQFVFPDGKRRVGFLLSSVERFFSCHSEQLLAGPNLSQIEQAESDAIFRHARRLASHCRCSASELASRIGRRLNRSPAAIFHTLLKHDQAHPAEEILPTATREMTDLQRLRILRKRRRGVTIATLARRLHRSQAAIYRVILDDRLTRLNRRKIKFIDDPLYHQDDAAQVIAAISAPSDDLLSQRRAHDSRVPRDLPPHLSELYRTPLLSPARERALFLAFHFHKFQFVSARRRLEPRHARARDLNLLEQHLADATETKNAIVRANLRLVVSVARQHLRPGLALAELISDGNLTLLRAVDGFDPHRGYRFSTYATLALMKGFARSVPQMMAARSTTSDQGRLAAIPDPHPRGADQRLADREHVRHLLSQLDENEQRVLLAHYGLDAASGPATYEQVGQSLGLSRQRVRQIERNAIAKLRLVEDDA